MSDREAQAVIEQLIQTLQAQFKHQIKALNGTIHVGASLKAEEGALLLKLLSDVLGSQRDLLEALVAARNTLAAFQTDAGRIKSQGGMFSATMTDGERKLSQAVADLDSIIVRHSGDVLGSQTSVQEEAQPILQSLAELFAMEFLTGYYRPLKDEIERKRFEQLTVVMLAFAAQVRQYLTASAEVVSPQQKLKRWTEVLCMKCGGNGVVKIPGGVSTCTHCDGRCYEPEAAEVVSQPEEK